jgi:hypothetical protein
LAAEMDLQTKGFRCWSISSKSFENSYKYDDTKLKVKVKVKQSLYTPCRRLGGEEV